MRRFLPLPLPFLVLFVPLLLLGSPARADLILLCGMDEVFVIAPEATASEKLEKRWSWRARDQKTLPAALVKAFGTTDDCKPIRDGRQILITSSGGGCALVDYPSGAVRWSARVPNAHSIELLPADRVVVASSTNAAGNRLVLFDLSRSEEPIGSTPLLSAHGVVWDADRDSLWAIGLNELRRYRLDAWDSKTPSLKQEQTWPLPDEGGHDLQPVPGTADLVVTSHKTVSLFNRDTREFRPHPELKDRPHVKAVAIHPASGKTFFIQAGEEQWWSASLQSLTPPTTTDVPGERLYKVRWLPAAKE